MTTCYRALQRIVLPVLLSLVIAASALASSHREAPLISNDPLADNTDLYAFRSPDNPNTITVIANFIPFELPEGGPNYYSFGENIRYEIHIDNDVNTPGDDIIYRFTFEQMNEDPTTFFRIRLGAENMKTTYTAEKSVDGGQSFTVIVQDGVVPPPNIGVRSIESAVGLNTSYEQLMADAVAAAGGGGGEQIFCGPVDDPFFVDLGGIFDLGAIRSNDAEGDMKARDGLAGFNCHTIALQIPIATLQKDGKSADEAANILDSDFIIGVWASASRPQITTLRTDGQKPDVSGDWIQISRLGMPLTNEAVIPVGDKNLWNATSPHDTDGEAMFQQYFVNPELALYMDDSQFGAAVPGFEQLRIQTSSLDAFDFRNGKNGLFGLPEEARMGTALSDELFGPFLLREGEPRSADLLPIFYTGVPNLAPYQLATGKSNGPLSEGKPFINNFLPTFGDALRLNMAVPPTPREDPDFSSLGLVQAAVLGLTDARFNTSAELQMIPNMDGFPNGRRLEDDVTRIELQAVSGVVLAAVGLWYDDFDGSNPVTQDLLDVLTFSAGPEANDLPLRENWPFMAPPHRGYDYDRVVTSVNQEGDGFGGGALGIRPPEGMFIGENFPNPLTTFTTLRFHLNNSGRIMLNIYDVRGNFIVTVLDENLTRGDYSSEWRPDQSYGSGVYIAQLSVDGRAVDSMKLNVLR